MKHQPLLRLGRLAVLGVLCLASCQVAKEINVADRVSYDLTVEASLPGTRTVNDDGHTSWVADDAISVLHSAAGETQFYSSEFYYSGEENQFKGRVRDVSTVNDWYLLYPYREDNVNAKQMHITVANEITQTGNDNQAHIAGEGMPLWGRELNVDRGLTNAALNVTMHHVMAVQKFSVFNETEEPIIVKKITMAVPSTVTGSYVGDLTANNLEWIPDGAVSQNVTVLVADGDEIEVAETGFFYTKTVPFTLKAGDKMNIHVIAVHPSNPTQEIHFYYAKSNSSDVAFTPGHTTPIPTPFDEDHQTPDPDAPAVKKDQTLSFANESWTWTLGDKYALNGIYDLPMTVEGAQTSPVTYSSDNASVAEITSEGKVLIKGIGYTNIKAIAPENEEYNSNEASFKLIIAEAAVTPSTGTSYVKASSLTVGGTYLVVDVSDTRLFKGNADGTYVSVSPANGVITDADNAFAGYEFTVTQSGSKYCIVFNDGKYLACDYQQSTGNNTTGIRYESNQPESRYLYDLTVTNGVFFFSTDQMNSTSTDQYLYYKPQADGGTGPDKFKIGGSGNKYGVHLYLKTAVASKQSQTLSFGDVTWTLGDTYQLNGTYNFPAAQDAMTTVTYESDNNSVVEIVGGTNRVKINGTGTAHITATAVETATYYGTSATMTFTIKPASTTPVTGSAYVKVTGEPTSWDGTYLFVDETSSKAFAALTNASSSGYAVNVTIENGRIAANSTVNQYALTVSDAGVAHANASGQRAYNVKNTDGNYIFYSNQAIQINSSNERSNTAYYHAFKYFAASGNTPAGVQVLSSGQSNGYNKYYLGYSSSAFGYAQNSDTRRIQLYKLEGDGGGTTPDPGTDPQPGTNTTYTKATSITVGGTYVITDIDDIRLFKGNADGSYVSVSPANGVITDASNSLAAYEFTVENNGSNYYLKFNDGKYLVCDYGSSGNGTTGIRYVNSQSNVTYPYALSVSNGAFEFSTTQITTTSEKNQVLYFKTTAMTNGSGQDRFKIGGSGVGVGVHLYLKTTSGGGTTPSKQDQTFSFSDPTVTWTLGNGHSVGNSYAMQNISGTTYGALTYSSSDTSVATISNGQIRIVKAGSTTISVTAAGNDTYNSRTQSYLLVISENTTPTTGTNYTKATSLTVGGTYLVVDVSDTRLFKGNADGSYVTITKSDVITDATGSYAGYEFTVTQSGSKYCIVFNDGKYLACDYQSTGNGTTGIRYESNQPESRYLYDLTVTNGVFFFSTDQMNSSSTDQYLYYKPQADGGTGPDKFKIGGSGKNYGVHLYLKNGSSSSKPLQNLSFAEANVSLPLETASGNYSVQTVQGAAGTVSYSSSNTSVATVNGTTITITGFGETKIWATAAETSTYAATSLSYTLTVTRKNVEGVWNLENDAVEDYLNYVEAHPYDNNYDARNGGKTYVSNYISGKSKDNRLDWPKPVTISWTSSSTSGSGTVTIYNDAAHTDQVEYIKPASFQNSNTVDMYNFIPGHTYYYVVRSSNNTQIASGNFSTTGRRRMINVSSTYNQNNANNCRDLGGQETTSGKRIKYGILYRGSNMDGTSSTEREYLKNYLKIELDVDLRETTGSNPLGVTVSDQQYNSMTNLTTPSRMGNTLKDIFNAVKTGKHAYIHCAVGADRTGFVCMVLEGLLGVPQNMCDVDYEMTSFSVVGTRERVYNSSNFSQNYYYSGSGKGVTYINENYSGNTFQDRVIAFAKAMGVTQDEITTFQSNMLE